MEGARRLSVNIFRGQPIREEGGKMFSSRCFWPLKGSICIHKRLTYAVSKIRETFWACVLNWSARSTITQRETGTWNINLNFVGSDKCLTTLQPKREALTFSFPNSFAVDHRVVLTFHHFKPLHTLKAPHKKSPVSSPGSKGLCSMSLMIEVGSAELEFCPNELGGGDNSSTGNIFISNGNRMVLLLRFHQEGMYFGSKLDHTGIWMDYKIGQSVLLFSLCFCGFVWLALNGPTRWKFPAHSGKRFTFSNKEQKIWRPT